jgi:hypothetical protein
VPSACGDITYQVHQPEEDVQRTDYENNRSFRSSDVKNFAAKLADVLRSSHSETGHVPQARNDLAGAVGANDVIFIVRHEPLLRLCRSR